MDAIPHPNLLALIPMLSDQLLPAVLNLGLLAMAAERAQQGLRATALRDPLTGVWNRAGFEVHSRALIVPGATILVLHLDHFKQINDRYGHLVGDSVLKAVAGLAGSEVESLGGEFGRLGGDEFLAVLPAWRAPYAQACAAQIQEACRRYTSDMPEWTVGLGRATVEHGESTWRDAFLRADRALYRAKLDGRNTLSE
ncbi:GGDEF domain-containing protein [Robbsia sp. KACC 23696]|uniref:GGDEF domain-containing protein n=1 Tax=Robbsia sp. KACC 23696 TaxID=3149231 RepID=UPI00325AC0A5